MIRVWHVLLIGLALLLANAFSAHAAPTLTVAADKGELRPGEQVTMTYTASPAAGDTAASWTIAIPAMPGLTLVSASGSKGTLTNQATLTSDGQAAVTSNKVTVYLAISVPNPVGGVLTVPVGVLQGGSNPAVVTLVWRY